MCAFRTVLFVASILSCLAPASLSAGTASVPALAEPSATDAVSKGVDSINKLNTYSLGLKWNESSRLFYLPVANPTPKAIKIVGVRSSGDIYICNVPAQIPPDGTVKLTLLLAAQEGSSNPQELVNVLTSAGEQIIQVKHDREPALLFDTTQLVWKVGDAIAPKNFSVTVQVAGVKVTGVHAAGKGNKAILSDQGGGTYQVQVTPGDTASPHYFPVSLDVNTRLPGANTTVVCQIQAASN